MWGRSGTSYWVAYRLALKEWVRKLWSCFIPGGVLGFCDVRIGLLGMYWSWLVCSRCSALLTHVYPADCELADIHVFLSIVHLRAATDTGGILFGIRWNLTTILCIATCVICLYDLILRADTISFTAGHISHALSTHVSSWSVNFARSLWGWLTFTKRKRFVPFIRWTSWHELLHMMAAWVPRGYKAVVHSRRQQWVIIFPSLV